MCSFWPWPLRLSGLKAQFVNVTQNDEQQDRRLVLAYYTIPTPSHFGRFSGFDLTLGFKLKDFWLDTFLSSTFGNFDAIGFNSDVLDGPNAEGFFQRTDEDKFNMFQTGMGLTHESRLLGDFFSRPKLYEYSSAFLTYTIFQDSLREEEQYGGGGFRADYAVNYRYTERAHVACRFSYNIAPVKREARLEGETADGRSLLLYWGSIGLDLTYFF